MLLTPHNPSSCHSPFPRTLRESAQRGIGRALLQWFGKVGGTFGVVGFNIAATIYYCYYCYFYDYNACTFADDYHGYGYYY